MKIENKYNSLKNEKPYLRLLCANILNRFGDSIDALIFAWMVYEITKDASWSALILVFNSLPSIIFMPFAGALVERYNRKVVMAISDILRSILVVIVLLFFVNNSLTPIILSITTFLISTLESFRIPAGIGMMPSLLSEDKYTVAVSLNKTGSDIAQLVGTAAFGILVANFGVGITMLINFGLFLLSGLLILSIKYKHELVQTELNFIDDFKSGIKYFMDDQRMVTICLMGCLVNFVVIPYSSLSVPYVREYLFQGEYFISIMSAALFCGQLFGTVIYPTIVVKISKVSFFKIGSYSIGVIYSALFIISMFNGSTASLITLLLIIFMFGASISVLSVTMSVFFAEFTDKAYLSRVGGITNAILMASVPVVSFITSMLARVMSVTQIYIVFGVVSVIMFTWLFSLKGFKEMDINEKTKISEQAASLHGGDELS